jgi:splicing suppressor protein 51
MHLPTCQECHQPREGKTESGEKIVLKHCDSCYWGWHCQLHKDEVMKGHDAKVCKQYQRMHEQDKLFIEYTELQGSSPCMVPPGVVAGNGEQFPTTGWEAYFKYRKINNSTHDYRLFSEVNTEQVSKPLTLAYALHALGRTSQKRVIVHVIGAAHYDAVADDLFEEVLHLFPSIRTLNIIFVGPELADFGFSTIYSEQSAPTCTRCMRIGIKLTYSFYEGTYEQFLASPHFSKPTLNLAFNWGLHEISLWDTAIPLLFSDKTPLCFTSCNENEARDDARKLLSLCPNVKILDGYPKENPYRSLMYAFDPTFPNDMWFNNYYIGLCQKE